MNDHELRALFLALVTLIECLFPFMLVVLALLERGTPRWLGPGGFSAFSAFCLPPGSSSADDHH